MGFLPTVKLAQTDICCRVSWPEEKFLVKSNFKFVSWGSKNPHSNFHLHTSILHFFIRACTGRKAAYPYGCSFVKSNFKFIFWGSRNPPYWFSPLYPNYPPFCTSFPTFTPSISCSLIYYHSWCYGDFSSAQLTLQHMSVWASFTVGRNPISFTDLLVVENYSKLKKIIHNCGFLREKSKRKKDPCYTRSKS